MQTEHKMGSFPADIIIVGFTGAIGSGCSFFAKEVAEKCSYLLFELSAYINHDEKTSLERVEEKQSQGDLLRQKYGNEYLVKKLFQEIDEKWQKELCSGKKGIVVSGIRNTGEIAVLRSFPNFYLFSIHADRNIRKNRLINDHKIKDESEFKKIDERDSNEGLSYGQQVKLCNDLADIIINNDTEIPRTYKTRKSKYIREKIIDKYIPLFEKIKDNDSAVEYTPSLDEKFMTIAFCESTSSRCLKRKVGAVIAKIESVKVDGGIKERGYVISSGYNDVPLNTEACIDDINLQQCYRDRVKEQVAGSFKYCPSCGEKIEINIKCEKCEKTTSRFLKQCECGNGLPNDYKCPKCQKNVFKEFLPGESSGKLLDLCKSLHAEENAIMNLIKSGADIAVGTTLYTTTYPCNLCANKIAELNMSVVYADPYPMEEAKAILEKRGIEPRKFEGVKSSMFFKLFGR